MDETSKGHECHGTPETVNGYPVVEARREWHEDYGSLPDGHAVICKRTDAPIPARPYVTWSVAWQRDRWVAVAGHYDLSLGEAVADLAAR